MKQGHKHILVLTRGQEDGGSRATLAFALAVSLQAMGSEVAIYLNSQSAIWAFNFPVQRVHIQGFDPLENYIDLFQEAGGELFVCATCVDSLTSGYKENVMATLGPFREGVTSAGLTTLASLIMERKCLSF
ncbi:MAG TPA: hypothetical protein DCE42_25405 [Myxococcales bacterium]|nr:hypothetical protein [Deltaproteobacteria bacterium]HAA58125.1 hypothetical protein [Myxococcales bacterium]|tara:strand:+ start:2005 stop:2397 length:393 start_codon:yes stop_codon:yes gene_type:complete